MAIDSAAKRRGLGWGLLDGLGPVPDATLVEADRAQLQDLYRGFDYDEVDVCSEFTGPLSLPMCRMRRLLAATSEFQTWCSAADATDALDSIYIAGADSITRPFAVVSHGSMWRMERYAGGAKDWFTNSGSLRVFFEGAIDSGDVGDHEDAETAFLNAVGGIMTAALVLSGSDDHITIASVDLEYGPVRSDEDEDDDYYQCRFAVTWGTI